MKACNHCGTMLPDAAKFCGECGSSQREMSVPADVTPVITEEYETVDVVIEGRRAYNSPAADAREVREQLIGEKAEYYLDRFEQMEALNSFTSWNWCAFFFGSAWMVYRKMYVFGIGLWAVNWLCSTLGLGVLSLIFWFGGGLVGNYLYMKDINNRTEKAMNMQPDERLSYIGRMSGVSWTGVLVMYTLLVVFNFLFI